MGTGYNPSIVTDGLVLCLDAANNRSYPKSGTAWSDLAGLNNGTLVNGPAFSADNGGGILFDGTDDYADFGNDSSLKITANVTVDFWIKLDSTQAANNNIFGSGAGNGGYAISQYGAFARRYYFYIYNSSGFYQGTGSTNRINLDADVWFHWCCVRDGTSIRQYINLTERTNVTINSANIAADSNPFRIGVVHGSSTYGNFTMSNFKVYNRALVYDEIRQNYEATIGRYS
jgi:hypothetical protein